MPVSLPFFAFLEAGYQMLDSGCWISNTEKGVVSFYRLD
jgi:hypothetical protein